VFHFQPRNILSPRMSQVWWKIILMIASITDLLSSQITVRTVVATVLVIRVTAVWLFHRKRYIYIYRMSLEECARLRDGVPYVKAYRWNPKHLCPKLNSYGDNGQRKVWSSGGSTHCTCQLTSLIDICPWVWCPMTESPLTLAYSRFIPECAVSHVTSVLAFMCHV